MEPSNHKFLRALGLFPSPRIRFLGRRGSESLTSDLSPLLEGARALATGGQGNGHVAEKSSQSLA